MALGIDECQEEARSSRRVPTAAIAPGERNSNTEGGEEELQADVVLAPHRTEGDEAAIVRASSSEALLLPVRRHG